MTENVSQDKANSSTEGKLYYHTIHIGSNYNWIFDIIILNIPKNLFAEYSWVLDVYKHVILFIK